MPILDNLLVQLKFATSTEGLHHAGEMLEGINHKLEILAGIEIAKGLYELVEHFSHFGDNLEQAAFQAGITAEQFQKLVYAGSQFNVTQDQIQNALAKMSRMLVNARDGSKGAIEQFQKLGISREQIASFNNAEDAFYAVQDALAAIPDSFRRVAATQAIFGRGATNLAKFASIGGDATRGLGEEAVKMGALVSNEGIHGLAEFEDSMQALGLTIRAFFANIAATIAPAMRSMIKDVQGLVAANGALVHQNFNVWAERIAFALGFVTEMFRVVAGAVISFVATHPKLLAFALKTAAIFFTMSTAGSVLFSAFKALKTVFTIITGAISIFGGTVVAIVAGITLLVLALDALWDMAHGKSFKDTAFGKSLVWLKDYAMQAKDAFTELTGVGGPKPIVGATDEGLASPMSNRALANQALSNQFADTFRLAGNGMGTLQGSAVKVGDGVPAMLRRPMDSATNVTVNAPTTVVVNGPANVAEIEKQISGVAERVYKDTYARNVRETRRSVAPAAAR